MELAKKVLYCEKKAQCKNSPSKADEKAAKKRLGEVNKKSANESKHRISHAQKILQDVINWQRYAELSNSVANERAKLECTETALARLEAALKQLRRIKAFRPPTKKLIKNNREAEKQFKTQAQQRDEKKLNQAERDKKKVAQLKLMMNTLLHKVKEYQKAFTKKPDKAGQQKLVAAQAKQKESAKKYTKASKQLMCSAALAKTAKID